MSIAIEISLFYVIYTTLEIEMFICFVLKYSFARNSYSKKNILDPFYFHVFILYFAILIVLMTIILGVENHKKRK